MKNCTPLWREAHFEVKSGKTRRSRTTFGSWHVEKVHAVVAPSTFWVKMLKLPHVRATFGKSARRCGAKHILTKNAKITTCSGHFWKWTGRKNARRCGGKHILSKNGKITACSGHFWTIRSSFDVEKVRAVVARSTFPSQKCQKLRVLSHFCCVRCRFVDR